jgi:lipoate-protein ligase B
VLTLGRHADDAHVLATPAELARRGIEVLRVERGGEVTYHGPGQLVAYPILALAARGLLLRPLVRALEGAMADTCAALGVAAGRRDGHPGCWVNLEGLQPRKIGALGVRVERGVTYHGIALNIDPDLRDFDLIDPCGMPGVRSTSIAAETGRPSEPPSTAAVARAAAHFATALALRLDAPVAGFPNGVAGTAAVRADLERLLQGKA